MRDFGNQPHGADVASRQLDNDDADFTDLKATSFVAKGNIESTDGFIKGNGTYLTGIVTSGGGGGGTTTNASLFTSGTLANERLSANISVSGNIESTTGYLKGNGSLLTSLNASSVSTGTLNTARLPSDISVAGNVSSANVIASGVDLKNRIDTFLTSTTRLYVKTNGSDTNDGRSWDRAFATIKHAADIAQPGTTIFVETGEYTENNPIRLRPKVAVIGDNLRRTILYAQNPRVDYFHVDNLCYLYGLRFVDLQAPAFCVAFPCALAEPTIQSGSLTALEVLYSPSGYASPPTVIIEAPEGVGGTQATATAVLTNGVITSLTITNAGSGYSGQRPHISIPSSSRPMIFGSPYPQNCSSITGPFSVQRSLATGNRYKIPETVALPYNISAVVVSGVGTVAVDEYGAGGGCRIDGAVCSQYSPLRSMVADSFTQVNQGGPGHLIINLGYAQFVSCFTTFCTYSFKCSAGGYTNVSTSVTDFGKYGLVSVGYWPTPIQTGNVGSSVTSVVSSVIIPDNGGGSGYTSPPTVVFTPSGATATATLFGDRVDSITVTSGGSYSVVPTVSFTGGGGTGALGTAKLTAPEFIRLTNTTTSRKPDVGAVVLYNGTWYSVRTVMVVSGVGYDLKFFPSMYAATSGDSMHFFIASQASTGAHVTEYVGSGVTYNALPEYGGIPDNSKQVLEVLPGRVYYAISDHEGNQNIGKNFAVNQLTGEVTISTDKFSLAGLSSIAFGEGGRIDAVTNNDSMTSSGWIVPTAAAVRGFVLPRTLPIAGNIGAPLVKVSGNDFDVAWVDSLRVDPQGIVVTGNVTAANIIGNLNASSINTGTLANARLPSSITVANVSANLSGNGVGIFSVNASNVATGTLDNARLPASIAVTSLAGNGSLITNLSATAVTTGTLDNLRLPSNISVSGNIESTTGYFKGNGSLLTGLAVPLVISTVQITDSSWTVLDDTAMSTSGGYCLLNGTGFAPGTAVSIGTDWATAVSYVSSTILRVQVPAKTSGSYNVTVIRGDTATATKALGLAFSAFPVWTTDQTLANVRQNQAFTRTLAATSDSGILYSNVNALPPQTTLSTSGVLSGNITSEENETLYTINVKATDAELQDETRPFQLQYLLAMTITALATTFGGSHSFVIANGLAYGFGTNNTGQLAQPLSTTQNTVPTPVTSGSMANKTVSVVACGGSSSMAICTDGTLHAWGGNYFGNFGISANIYTWNVMIPTNVSSQGSLSGRTPQTVQCTTSDSVFVVCTDGTLHSYGYATAVGGGNYSTDLGRTATGQANPTPTLVQNSLAGKVVTVLKAGPSFSLVLCSDGTFHGFGKDYYGYPTLITLSGSLVGKTISTFEVGSHALVLCTDGTLHGFGFANSNNSGQLGIATNYGTSASNLTPALINGGSLAGKTVTHVVVGYGFSIVACSDGTLHGFGSGGSVGNLMDFTYGYTPTQIGVSVGSSLIGKMPLFIKPSFMLATDKSLHVWGQNYSGRLSLPTNNGVYTTPVNIKSNFL